MAPLALTLALLPMAVATVTLEVIPLDMAPDSFDDQYRDCGPAMAKELPALNRSEFQQNPHFAEVWVKAAAAWQRRGAPESPLSHDQAIAINSFTMGLKEKFNEAVRTAGRSSQEYRDNFHYKTLHFLLTQALQTLREDQKGQCQDVLMHVCGARYEAPRDATVRFGQFMLMSSERSVPCQGKETVLRVYTCHGENIEFFLEHPDGPLVLIPPFETFQVTDVNQGENSAMIRLNSKGISSKYNCEWLRGGSEPRVPFHLRGLLLATTALAVATGML